MRQTPHGREFGGVSVGVQATLEAHDMGPQRAMPKEGGNVGTKRQSAQMHKILVWCMRQATEVCNHLCNNTVGRVSTR